LFLGYLRTIIAFIIQCVILIKSVDIMLKKQKSIDFNAELLYNVAMDEFIDIPQSEDLDEIDKKIIAALYEDGRAAFTQIAQQLNVSPGMIRARYNRMVKLGYLQIVAITNPLNIGFNAMALIGIRVDGSKLLEISEQIATLKEVVYLVITSGRYDIILEVMCYEQADLLRFLTDKLYKIDGIRESETFINLKIVKEIYL